MKIIVYLLLFLVLWKPVIGFIVYLIVYGLMIVWILFVQTSSKIIVKNDDNKYTEQEIQAIEKYHIFFRSPVISRSLSAMFSGFQLAVFVLTPYLIYRGYLIPAIIIAISYFISPQFSVTLDPQFFLHDNLDKGKIKEGHKFYGKFKEEITSIDSALGKMYLKQKDNQTN